MNINAFKGYCKVLDTLDISIKSKITELICFYNNDILTFTVCLEDIRLFEKLIEFKLNNKIKSIKPFRYMVDLSSINSEVVQIYTDTPNNKLVKLFGFKIDRNGKVLEKKIYKNHNKNSTLIDTYDSENNIISKDEVQIQADYGSWEGPKELIKIAEKLNYHVIFMKNELCDQCYLRIVEY
jgi:hypothetical protein